MELTLKKDGNSTQLDGNSGHSNSGHRAVCRTFRRACTGDSLAALRLASRLRQVAEMLDAVPEPLSEWALSHVWAAVAEVEVFLRPDCATARVWKAASSTDGQQNPEIRLLHLLAAPEGSASLRSVLARVAILECPPRPGDAEELFMKFEKSARSVMVMLCKCKSTGVRIMDSSSNNLFGSSQTCRSNTSFAPHIAPF